jgi:hypothetical protein
MSHVHRSIDGSTIVPTVPIPHNLAAILLKDQMVHGQVG